MKTSKEYRLQAAETLKGNYGTAIGVMIVFCLLVGLCASTVIGGIILGGALMLGYAIAYLNLFRNGRMQFSDLFAGFSNRYNFGSTIGVYVKSAVFVLLWSCLAFVPGIIAAYSYSMAYYILADHPEMTGGQAIAASKELMKGKKGKLFCLDLSYIGWILLCMLTLGILILWVEPRMQAARAAFYEDIKNEVPGTAAPAAGEAPAEA